MKTTFASATALLVIAILTAGVAARSLKQEAPTTLEAGLANDSNLSVLLEAIKAVPSLYATVQDPDTAVTLFAPSNTALLGTLASLGISDLPALLNSGLPVADILSYHVVGAPVKSTDLVHGAAVFTLLPGKRLIVDLEAGEAPVLRGFNSAANVTQADIMAGKCIIHVVDNVLLHLNPTAPAYSSIAAAAVAANLTSLVAALEKANLTSAVADPSLVATVMAPTNEAFAAALTSLDLTLDTIPVDVLTKILTYHVAPGYGPTARMVANGEVGTLLTGQTLKWMYPTKTSPLPTIAAYGSNATIVMPNVFAGQGVVHVVDTVLVPNLN